MKSSKATVEQNRQRLLDTASAMVRRQGIDGLRVAEVMREVGLTHGGFTTYFDSKEDMVAQACQATVARQAQRLARAVATGAFEAERQDLYDRYLSRKNRDNPDQACLFPSLAGDMPRQGPEVRAVFTEGLKAYLNELSALLDNDPGAAMRVLSQLVGAMVLARAVDDVELSDQILDEVREGLRR